MKILFNNDQNSSIFEGKTYLKSNITSFFRELTYYFKLNRSEYELIDKKTQNATDDIIKELQKYKELLPNQNTLSDKDINIIKNEVKHSYYKSLKLNNKIENDQIPYEYISEEVKLVINKYFNFRKKEDFNFYAEIALNSLKKKDQIYDMAQTVIERDPRFTEEQDLLEDPAFIELAKKRSEEINKCTKYQDVLNLLQNIMDDAEKKAKEFYNKEEIGGDEITPVILTYLILIKNSKLDDAIEKLLPFIQTGEHSKKGANIASEYGLRIKSMKFQLQAIELLSKTGPPELRDAVKDFKNKPLDRFDTRGTKSEE